MPQQDGENHNHDRAEEDLMAGSEPRPEPVSSAGHRKRAEEEESSQAH